LLQPVAKFLDKKCVLVKILYLQYTQNAFKKIVEKHWDDAGYFFLGRGFGFSVLF
jgi:hypothetical protein